MPKESFVVNLHGWEVDGRWSECPIASEELRRLIGQGKLTKLHIKSSNNPDFRNRVYRVAMVDLVDFYSHTTLEKFSALAPDIDEIVIPQNLSESTSEAA